MVPSFKDRLQAVNPKYDLIEKTKGLAPRRMLCSNLAIMAETVWLWLDLVYNPGGDFVPGSQQELEAAYKTELSANHGIVFNHLFTITNAPIGRFRDHLEAVGTYPDYLRMLAECFNPEAAGNIMCRTLISVDWQGKIYNCDFNQALGMPITADDGSEITISELDDPGMTGTPIDLAQHCYCCTAGEGSSCTGALVP
jgi:radical SAM/Cys-rich protein